jgi:methylmalonyl-CoA mutase cobalamin-binding domain/chain
MARRRNSRDDVPIRLLTAVPLCDGHDSAISTINLEFIRHGIEVVYLGYHRSVRDIVRAAVQEDVAAVGISSYNGGHVEFFSAVVAGLRKEGAGDIAVFGGGGGTISAADATIMKRRGVDRIFFPGESLDEMVQYVKKTYAARAFSRPARRPRPDGKNTPTDRTIARALTQAENGASIEMKTTPDSTPPLVIGVTGPGGAGKTTLIDELVLRFLRANPTARVAILSHDPSIVGDGALLGDRATMIYSQDDRVFMRSLASRGQAGGLSPATDRCLDLLRNLGAFDVIFVETVGIGQEAMPFAAYSPPLPVLPERAGVRARRGRPATSVREMPPHPIAKSAVDHTVLVMSPDYGSRLQLQKIVMLDVADLVVINKSDMSRARTASAEVEGRLEANGRGQKLLSTVAKRHGDAGVNQLFDLLTANHKGAPSKS